MLKLITTNQLTKKFYEVYNNNIEPFEIDALYAGDVIKKSH